MTLRNKLPQMYYRANDGKAKPLPTDSVSFSLALVFLQDDGYCGDIYKDEALTLSDGNIKEWL